MSIILPLTSHTMMRKRPVTISILKVRGREPPKPWAERVGASYDTEVEVTLTTQDQQVENLKAKLERSLAKADRRKTAGTFKIEDDPIFRLGENPIESEITDASTNHGILGTVYLFPLGISRILGTLA